MYDNLMSLFGANGGAQPMPMPNPSMGRTPGNPGSGLAK